MVLRLAYPTRQPNAFTTGIFMCSADKAPLQTKPMMTMFYHRLPWPFTIGPEIRGDREESEFLDGSSALDQTLGSPLPPHFMSGLHAYCSLTDSLHDMRWFG